MERDLVEATCYISHTLRYSIEPLFVIVFLKSFLLVLYLFGLGCCIACLWFPFFDLLILTLPFCLFNTFGCTFRLICPQKVESFASIFGVHKDITFVRTRIALNNLKISWAIHTVTFFVIWIVNITSKIRQMKYLV